MAAAGPAGNFVIAAGAFLALKAGLAADVFVAAERARYHHLVDAAGEASWLTGVGDMLSVLLVLNVLLFVFNMLPRSRRSTVPRRSAACCPSAWRRRCAP